MNYHMIVNRGTLLRCAYAQKYPRHLVLAQMLAMSDEMMKMLVYMKENYGTRIMLDNGAHEGIDIDIELYKSIVLALQPDVVVLTDLVGRPAHESRAHALKLARWVFDHPSLRDMQVMYAPQGRSQSEVIDEYEWSMGSQSDLPADRTIIGLGQAYLNWVRPEISHEAARIEMVKQVIEISNTYYPLHVLGARWTPTKFYGDQIQIDSVDTIKPCTATLDGSIFPHLTTGYKIDRMSEQAARSESLKFNVQEFGRLYGCHV